MFCPSLAFTWYGTFRGPGTHTHTGFLSVFILTNCMCSQQDEGQESLEEELDVLVLDDEGDQVSYPPMVCPLVTPRLSLRKEAPVCRQLASCAPLIRLEAQVSALWARVSASVIITPGEAGPCSW